MNDKLKSKEVEQLFEAILSLNDVKECYDFFEDVCTINELLSLAQRFEVAKMLREQKTYLEIAEKTGASTATISRVNRSLNYGNDGYDRVFVDYVIIDTPPLGIVIDAVIIGKYTDGAVIVIEQGVIKRKIVQDVIKQLKRGEVRIFGAVLNKVDERIGAYGNYEYKYSYSYYGESDTEKNHQNT